MGATSIDLIQVIAGSGLMVQFVLMMLFFFSVTTWTIMIFKFKDIRRALRESDLFIEFFWKSRDFSEAFVKAKQLQDSPMGRVFRVGFVELKKVSSTAAADAAGEAPGIGAGGGIHNVQRALRRAISTEVTRLTRYVPFLATTGNTTPFIGLFGTVWGIMNSFHSIGMRGSASLAVVAPGISEALVATAAGLAAAIPAVIAYNYFTQKIRMIDSELRSFSDDFLNIVERDILQSKGTNR
jgi:biopolymer transport protein TolQ